MSQTAFVIAGDHATTVANDVHDFRYRASMRHLPVGAEVAARTNDVVETQFMVEQGTVGFMINGSEAVIFAGDFVRVPPGAVHAYRNAGDISARLLVRTTSPHTVKRALRVLMDHAA